MLRIALKQARLNVVKIALDEASPALLGDDVVKKAFADAIYHAPVSFVKEVTPLLVQKGMAMDSSVRTLPMPFGAILRCSVELVDFFLALNATPSQELLKYANRCKNATAQSKIKSLLQPKAQPQRL